VCLVLLCGEFCRLWNAAAQFILPHGLSLSIPVSGDRRKVLGDASEAALLRYVDSLTPIFEFKMSYPTLFEVG
jgi:hypothetical protein